MATTPKKESEVHEQLSQMNNAISSLSEAVESLYLRLERVTRPEPQIGGEDSDKKELALVPLADELRFFIGRIHREIESMNALRNRIEL